MIIKNYYYYLLVFCLIFCLSANSSNAQENAWTYYGIGNMLPSDYITSIVTAPNGNVLLGTYKVDFYGGLAIYDGKTCKVINNTTPNFTENSVSLVAVDNYGKIYVRFQKQGGAIFNGSEWSPMDMTGLDTSIKALSPIVFDENGNMWAGLHDASMVRKSKGVGFYDTKWHVFNIDSAYYDDWRHDIFSMAYDLSGNLWVGTRNTLFKRNTEGLWEEIDSSKGFNHKYIQAITPDNYGNIWLASANGISHYDGTNWIDYDTVNSDLQQNIVYSMAVDKHDNLWLGTADSGLVRYDGETFSRYYLQEWRYYIYGGHELANISIDSSGNVWAQVGWNHGVFVFHPDLVSVKEESKQNNSVIFPNPAENYIYVQTSEVLKTSEVSNKIEIFSAIGIKVISTDYKEKIDVSVLSKGVYFLKIGNTVFKFVKI